MKHRVLYIACYAFLVLLFGCTVKLIKTAPSHRFNKSYTLKEPKVRPVGSTIIRIDSLFCSPTFISKMYLTVGYHINIIPGQTWIAAAEIEGKEGYVLVLDKDYHNFLSRSYGVWGVFVDVEGKIGGSIVSAAGAQGSISRVPDAIAFVETESAITDNGNFAAELLYSGITGGTLRLSYREYADDFARPAYSQDLTYNLSESNLITFRSLRIKIHRADNNEIEFSVEEDDDLPWVPRDRKLSVIR